MIHKPSRIVQIIIMVAFAIVSCSPQVSAPPTVIDVENSVRVLPTETAIPTIIPSETATKATIAPLPTDTATPIPTPTDVVALIGTPLSGQSAAIGVDNYTRLQRTGQWGRGSILGVGFTPDGKSFIAISELGWAIYNLDALNQPPQWVTFDNPVLFDKFYFSSDGTLIRFIRNEYPSDKVFVKSFPSGDSQRKEIVKDWVMPNGEFTNSSMTLHSPDGTKIFKGGLAYEYNEATFSEETSVREMYDTSGNLLYKFKDDAPYVTYSDRNGPEGCDLSVFSPCGNALMAVATTPTKALFSSDRSTFAALYEPPSLYSGIMKAFSFVRVYDSANGDLTGSLGGFTKPVQDFGYSPDGKLLVVGFVDGSIVLWDIKSAKTIFGSRHMNAPAGRVVYSQDSKYLLIQRDEELEVRLTTTGSLVSRYDAVEFAVSPIRNQIALGDDKGNIQIRDLDTGKGVMNIRAHDDRIYSLAFSPDGLYLASSGQDCDIKLWDLETGKLLHYFEETAVDPYEIGMSSRIFSTYLEFIPSKNMLIGFGSWGTVVNWNVNSGATNYVIQSDALQYYDGMVTLKPHFPEYFDTDTTKDRFYINENEFNLSTGESLGLYKLPASLPEGCSPVGPITNDKKLMFTRGYDKNEGNICVLDAGTFDLLGKIHVAPETESYSQWMNWLYLSPDGKQLIVTVGSGIVYVYQIV